MTKRITFLPILLLFSLWSYGQYCVPSFSSGCTDDHIDNFEIPSINFAHLGTGCSPGTYADYSGDSSLLIVLEAGADYEWSTTSGFGSQHVKIWVDINGDQVFDEATEEIDYALSVGNITEGEISIPAVFPPGTYRMRIATRWNSAPIPCNTAGYGEAHDYTVQILPPSSCPSPTALNAGNITDSSVELSWTENGTATAWDIEYGVSPYTPTGTPTVSGVSSNPYTLGGLAPLTSYEVYVRANCGGGDESNWFGPVTFTTLATGQATLSATYTAGDIPTQYNSSSGPFVVDDVCNGASTTLNLQLPAGGPWQVLGVDVEYAMTAVSGGGGWMSEQRSRIYFQNTATPEVSTESSGVFHGTGSATGTMSYSRTGVDIANGFYAGGENLTFEMHAWRTWESSSYPGCNTDVNKVDNNTWKIDVLYAPVTVCIPPSQVDINNITDQSASVSWSQVGSASSWEMEYVSAGNAPTGTGVSVTSPHVITGLTPLTEYDVYLRSVCGPGDESVWEGPFMFKTAADCSVYTLSVTTNDGYVCDEGTTILTASAPVDGDAIYWYDAATGGNFVGTGTSFETPYITQNTSFWAAEVVLDQAIHHNQGETSTTSLGSTTNGGITFNLTKTVSILNFEARSTSSAGGAVTYALIDVDNGNSVLMTHEDVLPGGGSSSSPVLYTVDLNFMNIPPGNYRLIKQSGAASAYMTGAFPYSLGTSGEITTGAASATSTSTLYYHFFNLTIEESELLCESVREEAVATVVTVEAVEASATDTKVDPGNSTTLTATSTNTNYTYAWTWDSTTGGGTGTATGASITVTPSAHTTYTVTATDTVTGCVATDEIEILVFNTALCTALDIVSVTDAYICDEGTAILTATPFDPNNEVYWYDAAIGGNLVGKGTSFETPFLTQTTSYWAAEVLEEGGSTSGQGKPTYSSATSGNSTSGSNWGLIFDAYEAFTIQDVEVYSTGGGGDITIQLQDNTGAMIDEVTVTLPGGGSPTSPVAYTAVLNMNVPGAGTYRLVRTASNPATVNMIRESSSNTYPYPLGTVGSITSGYLGGTSSTYYWFYNWTVSTAIALCESTREEAVATVVTVEAVEATATDTKVDPGNNTTLTATSTNANYTYEWTWDSATGGGTGTATGANITVSPSAHTTYTVTATDSVTGCVATDDIEILVFNTALCNTLDIITSTGTAVCVGTSATLMASASGTGDEIYWYDAATGGNLVGKGANFETPELTQTTSYWAAEVLEDEDITNGAARPLPTSTAAGYNSGNLEYGVVFDAYESFVISTVDVYSTSTTSAGEITIELADNTGATIQVAGPFTIPVGTGNYPAATPVTIPVNITVPNAGTSYRLFSSSLNVPLVRESSGGNNPHPIGTVGEVTAGWANALVSTSTYYFFYNWTVSTAFALCESTREEVIATVHDIDVVASATAICSSGGSSTLTASSATNPNFTYTWNPGNLTGASITVNPTQTTTYTVTAEDTILNCTVVKEVTVFVDDPAVVTVDPDDEIACMGSILELNSEITGVSGELTEDFEGGTNWTTVNNSTGGSNPAAAAWQAVSSPYSVSSQTLESNDASTFFITNSDVAGSGVTTDTELISPSFSLATATTASLSFYHYHRVAGSTIASVQISVDGGTTYTNLATYSSTVGSPAAFASETLSLDNYVGNSDVKIRFRYTGGWGYYWAIDNITISGLSLGTTWSPMADLYLDENATVPYAGEVTNTVYFSATTAGMVTYTASFTNGCGTVTADAEITVPSDAAPVGPANQNFVLGETLADLNVTGTNLTWYDDAVGTNIIPDTTLLVDATTYYVSQTISGCESQLLEITVTEIQPCDAPTNVVLVNVGTATAEFSWTASPHETNGYNWVVMEDGDDPLTDTPVDSGTTATGITTATATGLIDDTDYDFYVQTDCGSTNMSTWEGPLNFTTDEDIPVGNTWEVNVTDTGWGDEVLWELRDSNNTILLSGGNYGEGYSDTQTVTTSNEPLTFYISAFGFFDDNTPAYTVSCGGNVVVSGALLGGDDATHSGLVCGSAPPCADPSAIVISNVTYDSADVSWTENGTATEWEIEYGLSGFTQGSGTVVVDNDGTLGETLTGLSDDESYDVYVRAICSSTNASAWVGPVSFTTLEAPCADPSAIVVTNVTYDSADISWTENGTATEWEIEYGLSGFTLGSGTVVVDNDGTLGETLTGLDAEETYDVYVRAICSSTNASAWVGPVSFTTTTVNVADHDFSGFTYYPNPMEEVLNISSTQELYDITLFNIVGQQILTHKMNASSTSIDVSHLASGSYMMQVVSESGQVKYVRLIKE